MTKKTVSTAVVIGTMFIFIGCGGGSSSSTVGATGSSATEGTAADSSTGVGVALSGPCITNFTNRMKIESNMILNKIIYDSETAENLDVSYMKYNFNSESTIERKEIISGISNNAIVTSDAIIKDDSYVLLDGAMKIGREEGKIFLFTLDRVENNGDWTMLKQEVNNNECAATSSPTTWSFTKPMYFPDEL